MSVLIDNSRRSLARCADAARRGGGTDGFEILISPAKRKVATLFRFGSLDAALKRGISAQKNAVSTRLFRQRQAATVIAQPGICCGETDHIHAEQYGDGFRLAFLQSDLARMPATVTAAFAVKVNVHVQ